MKKLMIIATAAFVAGVAMADKVTLKSGSILTGKAGVIQNGVLKFKSDDVGDVEIKVENIKAIEGSGKHVVQYVEDDSKEEIPLTIVNGEYISNGRKLNAKEIKAIDPEEEKWHGSVNLQAAMARGNTVSESATLLADANRRWEYDRFTSNLGYYFAQSGDSKATKQKTASRFELAAQEDHFWSKKFYSYVNGKYEFDRIMDLDHRLRLGLGLGLQWFEKAELGGGKLSFNQEVGAAWVNEKYNRVEKDDYATIRYAHHLIWDPGFLEKFQLTHNFEYLPDFGDWADNYIIDADVGFTYALIGNWQLVGLIEWDYKSQTAPGVKNSDFRYMLGVGYKW